MSKKPTPKDGSDERDIRSTATAGDRQRMDFIRQRLRLAPIAGLAGISLYLAHSETGLGRLPASGSEGSGAPYWAYCWAGGLALAHHFAAHPAVVAGRRVLDLGAGGGIVAIAAAKAGARGVLAAEIDPYGRSALALNAEANGVDVAILSDDLLRQAPPDVDVVAVGDLFYEAALASAVGEFLGRCLRAGISVLIGDPGRRHLPVTRLERLAAYPVADFGHSGATRGESSVFRLILRRASDHDAVS